MLNDWIAPLFIRQNYIFIHLILNISHKTAHIIFRTNEQSKRREINILLIPLRCSMRLYPVIQKIINQLCRFSSHSLLGLMLLWEMLYWCLDGYQVNLLTHHLSYYHGFMTTYWNSFIILSIRSKPLIYLSVWVVCRNEDDDNNVIRVRSQISAPLASDSCITL